MRHLRNITAALLCSALISMAPMPPAAAVATEQTPVPQPATGDIPRFVIPDTDYPRPAMPHVDETKIIDDGSLYREVIVTSNESGKAAKSSDYVYGAADDKGHMDVWIPVRRNENPNADCIYEDAHTLCLDCVIDTQTAKGDDHSFDPVTVALIDEDGTPLDERPPMTTEEIREDSEEPGTAFRFMSGVLVDIPSKRYTLRITEKHATGDSTEDLVFSLDEKGEFAVRDDAGKLSKAPAAEDKQQRQRLSEKEYDNGVTLKVDAYVLPVEVEHRHSEILYDPTKQDQEFSDILAEGFPNGYTATALEHTWMDLLWRRKWNEANPLPTDLETNKPTAAPAPARQEGQDVPATGYVIALVAIATVGMLIVAATFVRRKK